MESRMPSPAGPAPGGSWQGGGGSKPSPPPMGEPGGHARGRGTSSSLTSAAWLGRQRRVVGLPLPLTQLLATFPKHLAGAHWVPRPRWTAVSCCGPPGSPAASQRGHCLPEPAKACAWGCTQPQRSAQVPACFPGLGLGEGAGSQAREGGRAREGAGSHQLTPSSAGAQGSHVVVASRGRRGVRARGDGVTRFGGAGGGRGVLSAPSPGAGVARLRGRGKGPGRSPHPRLSQARAGAGSGPLPRPGRSARPPPRPAGPRRAARAGGSYLLPGAAARGPGPGGGGGGGCGWAGSLRGAGRRQ